MTDQQKPRVKGKGRLRPCAICYEDRWEDKAHFPTPNRKGGGAVIPLCPTHHKLLDDGRLSRSDFQRLANSGLFEDSSMSPEQLVEWAHGQGYDYSLDDLKRKFWGKATDTDERELELYFAYGSNLCLEQIQERCPSAREFGRGFLRDNKLAFTHYSKKRKCGTADVVRSPGDAVWGMVYTMTRIDLNSMDIHEGGNYRRTYRPIVMDYRELPEVWTYEVFDKGQFLPSPGYLNIIKLGARRLNFPESYIDFLESIETIH